MLRRLRFRVTVNTDNRLMSNTSMSKEFEKLSAAFGWGLDDFEWITINTIKSAFAAFPERLRIDQRHGQAALLRPPVGGAGVGSRHECHGHRRRASGGRRRLARIRDVSTPNALFRQNLERIGSLLLVRATKILPTVETKVTPR